jgi:sugar-specific transcriptional regulator TrmB
VYLALLKTGPTSAGNLAKKTEILRSSIYDYIETLINKGFISYTIINNTKTFHAVDPEKIYEVFKEKKEEEEKDLKQTINELNKLKNTVHDSHIEIFEGKEGLKTALLQTVKEGIKEIMIFGASGTLRSMYPLIIEQWNKRRGDKQIILKMLYNNTLSNQDLDQRKKYEYIIMRKLKTTELSYTNTFLFNNKVLILIIDKEYPISILVENKKLFDTYKNNFNLLWNKAKEYYNYKSKMSG